MGKLFFGILFKINFFDFVFLSEENKLVGV